jgi:hypothetical protein
MNVKRTWANELKIFNQVKEARLRAAIFITINVLLKAFLKKNCLF